MSTSNTTITSFEFLHCIRKEFMPQPLTTILHTLPNNFKSLATLQSCKTVSNDHKFVKWVIDNANVLLVDHIKLRDEVTQHAVRVLFFITCLQSGDSGATVYCFPNLPHEQHPYFYKFCNRLLERLLASCAKEVQGIVFHVYLEYIESQYDVMLQSHYNNLKLTPLVPPSIFSVLVLLCILGYPHEKLPKAFSSFKPLLIVNVWDAIKIIFLELPNHVDGFKPEADFAREVYGDETVHCLHQVLVLQCKLPQIHTLWKCCGWRTDKTFQHRIRHYKGYGSLESEDVVKLLQTVVIC
jgi:hypothetical protein